MVWQSAKQPRDGVLFELGVSDHSKAYLPVSRGNVAQFEVHKTLILLGNSAFGRPYFEPGAGGSSPSGRAKINDLGVISFELCY